MKTVLFALPRGWDRRFVLRTGVLEPLLKAGIRPVILTPRATDPEFRAEFAHLDLENYEPHTPGNLEGTYRRVMNFLFAARFPGHTLETIAAAYVATKVPNPAKRAFYRGLGRAGRSFPGIFDALKRAEPLVPVDPRWKSLFEKWKPDAVITMPLFDYGDIPILKWAERYGVPKCAIVTSWDNISTKGAIAVRPDALVVWNDDMREEAERTHGYPADRVAVTGVPPFDHWADPPRTSREEFMKKYGLDPSRKMIGYFGAGNTILPNEHEVLEHVIEANEAGVFGQRLSIFVRLHPIDHREAWDRFRNRPGIVVELPRNSRRKDWDADRDDLDHLADTVRACDVSMNVGSTITIESCIADRPVINIGYDGNLKLQHARSVARVYERTHLKRIPECGIPVAYSREELIALTKGYLDDPGKDREARLRVRERLVGRVGGAAERTGRALASFVMNGPSGVTRFE
ncbi:MAG: hypothetical protein K8T20_07245 [Planctomycetes bacterium]|nr:hypothetical protein [Planctomycetota bacterium]